MNWISKLLGLSPKPLPVRVDDANFEAEVLRSPLPVLVDVWSTGCGPCKQLEPVILQLAAQYRGRVKICELHVGVAPISMARLGIQATPTVLYFQSGRELERVAGFRSSLFHAQTIEELFGVTASD